MNGVECFAQDGLGYIQLAREQALNALNIPMMEQMITTLQDWQENPEIRAIVLQKQSGKAFCAGGDIRAVYQMRDADTPDARARLIRIEYQLDRLIGHYTKPVIAFMDGITFGGGAGIALNASHPVVTENTLFAMPEVRIGLFPDAGIDRLLAALPHAFGVYLGMTGTRIHAGDMLKCGLVYLGCMTADIPAILAKICTEQALTNERLDALLSPPNCLNAQTQLSQEILVEISEIFALTQTQAILDALAKSTQPYAKDALDSCMAGSPLSLMLARMIMQNPLPTLDDTLARNYILASHCLENGDFYEGVRALLIDKDNSPHWLFPSIPADELAFVAQFAPPFPSVFTGSV